MAVVPYGLLLALLVPFVTSSHIPRSPPIIAGRSSTPPSPTTFRLKDNIVGSDFFTHFAWETFDDPTHGRVNYVDQPTALERNLTSATEESFIMRADDTNIVSKGSRGRDSNRIRSYNAYTDSVLVLDVKHVPWGCATWPAFWTVTDSGEWPNGGEIDIIEGVNLNQANLASLHTSPGCQMEQDRTQSGDTTSTDCNAFDNNNQGCGTSSRTPGSYGSDLNQMGGGWFVMKRTQSDGVYVWFFGRNDPYVPAEVKGDDCVNPDDHWGIPDARFPPSDKCNFASHFGPHNIVFDLTFCGDWAGGNFLSSGCAAGTCDDYVNNSPQNFQDAYWEINALRVYVP